MTGSSALDRKFVTCRLCGKPFRAVSYFHLALVHSWDSSHPILEYKRRFRLLRHESASTRTKRTLALHGHLERTGRRWTRERLIALVASRKRRNLPLNMIAVRNDIPMAPTAARRYFGGWDGLLSRCGIRLDSVRLKVRWSKARILHEIREMLRAGIRPSFQTALRRQGALPHAALRHFGGWDQALRAAGCDPQTVRRTRNWSRRAVIAAIRKLGRPLRSLEVEKEDPGLLAAAMRFFGSWPMASRAAGFPYSSKPRPPKWPREQVLAVLRDRARAGKPLTCTALRRVLPGLVDAVRRYFATWREAVNAAGCGKYLPAQPRQWERSEILDALRKMASRHGVVATPHLVQLERRDYIGIRRAIELEFGSLARARTVAGVQAKPRLLWTPERFRREIARLRCPLRAGAVARANPKLRNAAVRIFGGWASALRDLGIPHPGLASRWTRDRILAATRELVRRDLTYGSKWSNRNLPGLFRAASRTFGSLRAAARAAGCPQVAGLR